MNRKDFLKNSAISGGATILPTTSVFTQNVTENGIDKLVDSNGNFVQQPLPFRKSFLEPHMDEETLHLHFELDNYNPRAGLAKEFWQAPLITLYRNT